MAALFDIAKSEVLSKVTIPMYFYNIIVPQLGSYYDLYPVDFENKPVVCCPLHDEETPSFRYYADTNSFYCFGCAHGGNVINLHIYYTERMNGNKVDYREAVFFLYDYFVIGKDIQETFANTNQMKPVKLNTEQEIIKFNIYRINLEKAVTQDNTLKESIKKILWEELDRMDTLLSLNMIKTSEAEAYLKDKVREVVK